MCAWRKSLKIYNQVYSCVNALKDSYKFIFITLTCKNCKASELSETLDLLYKSYTNLMRRKRLQFVQGAFRAVEITYNKTTDEFNPHLHTIWVVPNNYFESADYLPTSELVKLWQKSLKVEYTPICFIEKIKSNKKGKDPIASAVAEVAKYPLKCTDFLCFDNDTNDYLVDTLSTALSGRHMFEFYGVLAEIRKKLNFDDIENSDLININEDKVNTAILIACLRFIWSSDSKAYVMIDVVEPCKDELLQGLKPAGNWRACSDGRTGGFPFLRGDPSTDRHPQ
jgi:plasmid rolling circle replication initiator protein Rep